MKGIYCTEFGKDGHMEHIIGKSNGKKTAYDIDRETFIEDGANLGVIELPANDIIPEKTDPRIMKEMEEKFKNRITDNALRIKENMIKEENNHEAINNNIENNEDVTEKEQHAHDDEATR